MRAQTLNLVPVTQPSAVEEPKTSAPSPELASPPPAAAEADPPTPSPATSAAAAPKPRQGKPHTASTSSPPSETSSGGRWREWGSFDRTVSYRLPGELIDELEERLWELRIKEIGVTVAAALTHLLDLDDDELRELVERANAAKPGRRVSGRR